MNRTDLPLRKTLSRVYLLFDPCILDNYIEILIEKRNNN